MRYEADTHAHTTASGHAYSSVREMMQACLLYTSPPRQSDCSRWYFFWFPGRPDGNPPAREKLPADGENTLTYFSNLIPDAVSYTHLGVQSRTKVIFSLAVSSVSFSGAFFSPHPARERTAEMARRPASNFFFMNFPPRAYIFSGSAGPCP